MPVTGYYPLQNLLLLVAFKTFVIPRQLRLPDIR